MRQEPSPILVSVLTRVAPWVTLGVTIAFLSWWVTSRVTGRGDSAAATVLLFMTLLTACSWVTRSVVCALLAQLDRESSRKP